MKNLCYRAPLILLVCVLFILTGSTAFASGVTWTNQTTNPTSPGGKNWQSIASSADGTKLAAVADRGGNIWTSTDSGQHWTNQTSGTGASGLQWQSIASSADSTKLAAVESTGPGVGDIWTSTDSGQHWTNQTTGTGASGKNWYGVSSSADGTKLVAVVYGGDIWTS